VVPNVVSTAYGATSATIGFTGKFKKFTLDVD